MPKRHHITEEQVKEMELVLKKNKDKNIDRRVKALLLHAQGIKHSEIASRTGFAASYISALVRKYCGSGLSVIVSNNYSGNHRNLSYTEEEAVLSPFIKMAQAGQVVEVSAIKSAYETRIGRSLEKDHGQIYRVLKRHGWRKVMPRSKHPKKATKEAIDASKKLKLPSETRWQILQ